MPGNTATATVRQADDPLSTFRDGARDKATGTPVRLLSTRIGIRVLGGLALVRTERKFRNDEAQGIEVTSTFPVPVHAHLLAMAARVGGRVIEAKAQRRVQARETYEEAIDTGKTAVLHEELVRGIHMLSVGHVGPGEEVTVATTWAQPLSAMDGTVGLTIPTTVGEVYGRSPLADSDDLRHGPTVHEADVEVTSTSGAPYLLGGGLAEGKARVRLDAPINVILPGWAPSGLSGVSADGRAVRVEAEPIQAGEATIAAELLLDGSGSMLGAYGGFDDQGRDKFKAMLAGVAGAVASLRPDDRFRVWEFADTPREIAVTTGNLLGEAVWRLKAQGGGTETGRALMAATANGGSNDVLVVTDGKSHALDVQALTRTGKRFTVVLIGEDSLEAHIGHLAALTGGQVFVTGTVGAAEAVRAALLSMRAPHSVYPPITGQPAKAEAWIGGMHLVAEWGGKAEAADEDARLVGAYAACLAIPHMVEEDAVEFAVAHGLVCHLTSLVLVDEAGEVHQSLPAQRQVALSAPRAAAGPMRASYYLAGGPISDVPTFRRRLSSLFSAGSGASKRLSSPAPLPPGAAEDLPPLITVRSLRGVLNLIDWSDAERIRRGDLSGLSSEVLYPVLAAADASEVMGLAARLGVPPTVVALALAARADAARAGREAARFARAVLGKADEEEIKAASVALGMQG